MHLPTQIGLLREYWELEFASVKTPFAMDIERVVDDFVLLCMLVGNDFLPGELVLLGGARDGCLLGMLAAYMAQL